MRGPLPSWEGAPPAVWKERWGVPDFEAWASLGSTNDRALALGEEGAAPFTVVVADEQTAGRGRRGATWHSPAGAGLWMSVLLPAAEAPAGLPLLVGLAAAEALEDASGVRGVAIKWPNDLFLGGRKVGGVLCEATGGVVVAGVGVNVRTPPGGFPEPLRATATSLEAEGAKELSRSHLAVSVVKTLEAEIGAAGELGAGALERLQARDALAGRAVQTEERGPGVARGVAPDGALILERPDGSRVGVTSGSVRLVGTPGARSSTP